VENVYKKELHNFYSSLHINIVIKRKGYEMSRACGMYGGKNAYVVLGTNLKERVYLEDLGVDERIILNKRNGTPWTGYIWTSGGLL